MAEDASIQWVGAPEFARDMLRLNPIARARALKAMEQTAQSLVPVVRSRMPKVSGALAASVMASSDNRGVSVDADTPYAGWIEFGGTRGRPYVDSGRYLTPVVTRAASRFGRAINTSLTKTTKGFPWTHTSR